jgi:hypothetical protein
LRTTRNSTIIKRYWPQSERDRWGQGLGAGIARALAAETTEDDLDRWQAIIRQIPLGRMGDPEADIGRAVVAVVSDDLAYLTGATLLLDGGRIMLP